MTLTLFLGAAMLCTPTACHPALVGDATPVGVFPVTRRYTATPGYGGDVLEFADSPHGLFAIHRVWLGRPAERRAQRLAAGDVAQRRGVTNGCVNVSPEVYATLTAATRLEVKP